MFTQAKPEQKKAAVSTAQNKETKYAPNVTGIPDGMKSQYENISGLSFDDVRIHYNSDKPAQLQALAYTQGNNVYVGPGQENHLKHELGHVVQQKRGNVQATTNIDGVAVNDNIHLEQEADSIGAKIMPQGALVTRDNPPLQMRSAGSLVQFKKCPRCRKEEWACECAFGASIRALNSTTLKGNLGYTGGDTWQAHHLIPDNVYRNKLTATQRDSEDFDDDWNGIVLPTVGKNYKTDKTTAKASLCYAYVWHANHPSYDERVKGKITAASDMRTVAADVRGQIINASDKTTQPKLNELNIT